MIPLFDRPVVDPVVTRALVFALVLIPCVPAATAQSSAGRAGQARSTAARMEAYNLRAASDAHAIQTGRRALAGNASGTAAFGHLVTRPTGAAGANWRGPYLSLPSGKPPFTDPWGREYRKVVQPGAAPGAAPLSRQYISNGPDGLPGTADDIAITG